MTLELNFPAHTQERSNEGTQHVQNLHEQFNKGNRELMAFWQRNRYWLSNEDARDLKISSYCSARVHDLIGLGIPIEKKQDGVIKRFRLKCTCKIVAGLDVTDGCWAHDSKLKVL